MKVILLKDVKNLGEEGAILEVKNGYARNFLIPQEYALAATKENFKRIDDLKRKQAKLFEKKKLQLTEFKDRLEKLSLTITAQVKDEETEEIYGSVTETQIFKALADEDIVLEKGTLQLQEPLKKIGVFNVPVQLHPEVTATLRVWIVKK